jgi:hypothetical protein
VREFVTIRTLMGKGRDRLSADEASGDSRSDQQMKGAEIMDPKAMAQWAYSHACDRCHAGEECGIDACISAQEVAGFLERMERIDTTDDTGRRIRGWMVADQV